MTTKTGNEDRYFWRLSLVPMNVLDTVMGFIISWRRILGDSASPQHL